MAWHATVPAGHSPNDCDIAHIVWDSNSNPSDDGTCVSGSSNSSRSCSPGSSRGQPSPDQEHPALEAKKEDSAGSGDKVQGSDDYYYWGAHDVLHIFNATPPESDEPQKNCPELEEKPARQLSSSSEDDILPSRQTSGSSEQSDGRQMSCTSQTEAPSSAPTKSTLASSIDMHGAPGEDSVLSVGSALHNSGQCKPCLFFYSEVGCRKDEACLFCHSAHKGKSRPRPNKDKRVRYRKLITLQQAQSDFDGEVLSGIDGHMAPSSMIFPSKATNTNSPGLCDSWRRGP